MIRNVVIMAGGSGERFWPLSRKNRPKQLLELTSSGKVMIAEAIGRITPLIAPENIYIITGQHLKKPIEDCLPNLPKENVIAEPAKRNTAPCLALAAGILDKKNSSEQSVAVLTADQIIEPEENFRKTIEVALSYVESNNVISTIGIKPDRAETGYGYIQTGEKLTNNNNINIFKIESFKEKPDEERASDYLHSGKYLWNSGMFFFRLDTFIEEMKKNAPEIGNQIAELNQQNKEMASVFESFPSISIDYALMEKTDKAVVTEANFEWDDLGAFDALDRVNKQDSNGNVIKGQVVAVNCTNSIIINSSSQLTTCYGLDKMVLIQSEDAVMSCKKEDSQYVKQIVDELKSNGLERYL